MFVGLAPGRRGADRTGVPFTRDASGRLFRRALVAAGVDERDVFVTNVVKCNPNDGTRNQPPTAREIANCLGYLEREVALVRPRRVVAVGRVAERVLRGAFPGRLIEALPHPAYAARHTRRYGEPDFVSDVRRIFAPSVRSSSRSASRWASSSNEVTASSTTSTA